MSTGAILNQLGGGSVPSGVIVMWSGETTNIPSGWFLCDGQNGTPDLRNRFIVGAGSSYGVGDTGGSNSVTLSVNQMPNHSHTGNVQLRYNSVSGTFYDMIPSGVQSGVGAYGIATQNNNPNFTKVKLSSAGGSSSHENRPPYYALAYIMKA